MKAPMPAVWTELHRLHEPGGEVWLGVRIPGTEVPARGEAIRQALEAAGADVVPPRSYDDGPLLAVHDRALLEYLEHAYEEWEAAGYPEDPGQDRVVPYVFPLPQVMGGRPVGVPVSPSAKAGRFAMDTMTLIGPGTFQAARSAVEVALTAADLVGEGAPAAYAACRPPGHHVGRDFFGGSCYLNNAAAAAQRLLDRGADRVAVVDLDAHHGNGTQEIFYRRGDVFYGSVHVDPGAGWFPHYVGFASETGEGEGLGCTHNLPLPPGSGDDVWTEAVTTLVEQVAAFRAETVVVSLGVDAAAADPESPLRVTEAGFGSAGSLLAGLGIPCVFIQEGGYDLASLGSLVLATLGGYSG